MSPGLCDKDKGSACKNDCKIHLIYSQIGFTLILGIVHVVQTEKLALVVFRIEFDHWICQIWQILHVISLDMPPVLHLNAICLDRTNSSVDQTSVPFDQFREQKIQFGKPRLLNVALISTEPVTKINENRPLGNQGLCNNIFLSYNLTLSSLIHSM